MKELKFYILNVLLAIDQLLNALLFGHADETLSSRAWRSERDKKYFGIIFRPCIDALLFFDRNHCYGSYLQEVARRQLPNEFQKR